MFKNKHIIAALIITPVLSVIAYFAVDVFVSEKPQAAQAGQNYPLVAKSNCRYTSGVCLLQNSEFKVHLRVVTPENQNMQLQIDSNVDLIGAKVALSFDGIEGEPVDLRKLDEQGRLWGVNIPDNVKPEEQLRLVVRANESNYFGETGMTFMHRELGFEKK